MTSDYDRNKDAETVIRAALQIAVERLAVATKRGQTDADAAASVDHLISALTMCRTVQL